MPARPMQRALAAGTEVPVGGTTGGVGAAAERFALGAAPATADARCKTRRCRVASDATRAPAVNKAATSGKRSSWLSWAGPLFPPALRRVPEIGIVFLGALCSNPNMAKVRQNKQTEQRIQQEIIVDAYGAEEQAMGWYYYLEEQLRFTFRAKCNG